MRQPRRIVQDYLTSAMTNERRATNSARARAMIPGVNIVLEASGFLAKPLSHPFPIRPIPIAAPIRPRDDSAKRSIVPVMSEKD